MSTEFGNRLKQARKDKGYTQAHLAELTGISQSTISTAEISGTGSAETPIFAKCLEVDAYWLATGLGQKDVPSGWPFKLFHQSDFNKLTQSQRESFENEIAGAILRIEKVA